MGTTVSIKAQQAFHSNPSINEYIDRCIYDPDMVDNVKYAYNHGHQVASHTWGHRHLASLTWDQSSSSP